MRKKLIAGNWKMNKTLAEAVAFAEGLAPKMGSESDVVFCVPAPYTTCVQKAVDGTGVLVGAQNIHQADYGAFTGEISAVMLKEMGVGYCIIGHSERREYFGETDELVNLKTKKALEHGLVPIVCVGERLDERDKGVTIDLVRMQVKLALDGISGAGNHPGAARHPSKEGNAQNVANVVIAYEPIWAIGTGRTATAQQAQEVCGAIRQVVKELYCQGVADEIRILYGGSVSAANANELFTQPDIDGGLVGGASIKDDFERVVKYGRSKEND